MIRAESYRIADRKQRLVELRGPLEVVSPRKTEKVIGLGFSGILRGAVLADPDVLVKVRACQPGNLCFVTHDAQGMYFYVAIRSVGLFLAGQLVTRRRR